MYMGDASDAIYPDLHIVLVRGRGAGCGARCRRPLALPCALCPRLRLLHSLQHMRLLLALALLGGHVACWRLNRLAHHRIKR